jgi:cytochrome d ubiquinol oxidase subunit I
VAIGDQSGVQVAEHQPAKLAAMESFWNTSSNAPFTVFLWPDPGAERNAFELLRIPGGLSLMSFHRASAEVMGLKEFPPNERPPVLPTFLGFRVMVALGFYFIVVTFLGWRKARRGKLEASRVYLKVMLYGIPLPYIAAQSGWVVTEIGRQPWIVYNVMKTADGVSATLQPGQVITSLIGFTLLYGLLAAVDIYLLAKYSRANPEEEEAAPPPAAREAEA